METENLFTRVKAADTFHAGFGPDLQTAQISIIGPSNYAWRGEVSGYFARRLAATAIEFGMSGLITEPTNGINLGVTQANRKLYRETHI